MKIVTPHSKVLGFTYAGAVDRVSRTGGSFAWFVCFFLVILAPLDWLFPSDETDPTLRMIPHILHVSLMLLLLIYAVRGGIEQHIYRSGIVMSLTLFAAMLLIHVIYAFQYNYTTALTFAKHLYWIIGAVAFYRMTLSKELRIKHIQIATTLLVIIVSIQSIIEGLIQQDLLQRNSNCYLILWFIPLLLLKPRATISFISLLLLAYFAIFFALKRGALIALVLSSVTFLIVASKIYPNQRKKYMLFFLTLISMIVVLFVWRWEYLILRFADFGEFEKAGSGRGTFYMIIIRNWLTGGTAKQIFGAGFWSVPGLLSYWWYENYAHSDWLEILYDYGLVGVALFVSLHLAILSLIRKAYQSQHPVIPALAMGYCIFFLANIYSGCIMFPQTIWFSLLLGYSAGRIERDLALTSRRGL